jgi:hypothetical protein
MESLFFPSRTELEMAVELTISRKGSGDRELVPVATSEVYRKYWREGCAALRLQLITRFQDGVADFAREDLSAVIEELRALGRWFDKTQSPAEARALTGRVNSVIRAFERVRSDPTLTIG